VLDKSVHFEIIDLPTSSAVGSIAPVGIGESSSVDSRGKSVLGERTLSTRGVTSVESGLARQSALGDSAGVG
jgi:hypothetical protein